MLQNEYLVAKIGPDCPSKELDWLARKLRSGALGGRREVDPVAGESGAAEPRQSTPKKAHRLYSKDLIQHSKN